ncbi:ATP-binding protein [Pseudomonas saponiphila]|uniref:hypothetical protein n=1 Tax=Pseudomonas saponiphila TaxID=556534 RepID=UPI002240DFC9|nr:hypothetical protein [Pseudomonas saponiphila]
MCKPMIVTGPAGSGKTKNAEAFMRVFGCSRLVEEWDGVVRLRAGDLALTNLEQFQILPGYQVLTVEQALEQIKTTA